jgi:hypothetical protein
VAEKRMRAPIVETLHDHWRVVAAFAGLSVFSAVIFYIGFVYLVSWLQTADGIPPSRSLEINTFSMVVSLPVLIAAKWLSDWVGRRPLMLLAAEMMAAIPPEEIGRMLSGVRADETTCTTWLGRLNPVPIQPRSRWAPPEPIDCAGTARVKHTGTWLDEATLLTGLCMRPLMSRYFASRNVYSVLARKRA